MTFNEIMDVLQSMAFDVPEYRDKIREVAMSIESKRNRLRDYVNELEELSYYYNDKELEDIFKKLDNVVYGD